MGDVKYAIELVCDEEGPISGSAVIGLGVEAKDGAIWLDFRAIPVGGALHQTTGSPRRPSGQAGFRGDGRLPPPRRAPSRSRLEAVWANPLGFKGQ